VCTVVFRWQPDDEVPVRILALRDELASRAFDEPDEWWPDSVGVVGGRDRTAGGSWCVSEVASGTTAVVLNRPERRQGEPGAPSRGVLPLLAVAVGEHWADEIDIAPMAGFNLGLITPASLQWWSFDGTALEHEVLDPGTWMLTPRGRRTDPIDARLVDARVPADWIDVVRHTPPSADPSAGIVVQTDVQTAAGDDSYETVFGQVITARPGALRLDYLSRVARDPAGAWTTRTWP
jgi:hypothetical protein